MELKTCLSCNKDLPLNEFHKDKSRKDGHREKCKDCRCKLPKTVHKKCVACGDSFTITNPNAKQRKYCGDNCQKVHSKYGISEYEHEDLLITANYKCEICGKEEIGIDNRTGKIYELAIDHCHKTGKVRGVLCASCNTSLGGFKDDTNLLQKAIQYLNTKSSKDCPSFNAIEEYKHL